MSVLNEKHWSEQKLCEHTESVFVVRVQSNGVEQVLKACPECGFVRGTAQPYAKHPNRNGYLRLERHPFPCECHPRTSSLAELGAESRVAGTHRTYARLGAELDIDIIVLCRDCHERHHASIGEHSEAA